MVSVAGASRFLGASTLANSQGLAAQSPTLLGSGSTLNILDAAKATLKVRGIGISSSARTLNNQLMNNSADVNKMFSLGAGGDASVEGATIQIQALRSRLGFEKAEDSGNVAPGANGKNVNKQV